MGVFYIGFQVRSPQDTSHTRLCTASNTCIPPHESYRHAENCFAIPEGKFISIVVSRALALMWSDDGSGTFELVADCNVTVLIEQ